MPGNRQPSIISSLSVYRSTSEKNAYVSPYVLQARKMADIRAKGAVRTLRRNRVGTVECPKNVIHRDLDIGHVNYKAIFEPESAIPGRPDWNGNFGRPEIRYESRRRKRFNRRSYMEARVDDVESFGHMSVNPAQKDNETHICRSVGTQIRERKPVSEVNLNSTASAPISKTEFMEFNIPRVRRMRVSRGTSPFDMGIINEILSRDLDELADQADTSVRLDIGNIDEILSQGRDELADQVDEFIPLDNGIVSGTLPRDLDEFAGQVDESVPLVYLDTNSHCKEPSNMQESQSNETAYDGTKYPPSDCRHYGPNRKERLENMLKRLEEIEIKQNNIADRWFKMESHGTQRVVYV